MKTDYMNFLSKLSKLINTLVSSLSLQTRQTFLCASDLIPIKQQLILLTPAQQLIKSTIFIFHSHNCVHVEPEREKEHAK